MHLKRRIVNNHLCFVRLQKRILASVLLTVIVTGANILCFAQDGPVKGYVNASDQSYLLGPGDIFNVQVYHQPDFNQDNILIRPDGRASLNGIGDILIAGKTVGELSQLLEGHIHEYVLEPQVVITLTRTKPASVYLAGAVKHPGMYQLTTTPTNRTEQEQPGMSRLDMRLSNVLAHAGGVQLNADLSQVEIRRSQGGKIERVNLWAMLKEGVQKEDVWLESGDTVYVPPVANGIYTDETDYNLLLNSSIGPGTFPVRLMGQVTNPGVYELTGSSPQLNSALSKAGGLAQGGQEDVVAIRRFYGGTPTVLYANPQKEDIVLKPNDVVYVPERQSYRVGRWFEQVGKVFSPLGSLGSAGWGFASLLGIGGFQD